MTPASARQGVVSGRVVTVLGISVTLEPARLERLPPHTQSLLLDLAGRGSSGQPAEPPSRRHRRAVLLAVPRVGCFPVRASLRYRRRSRRKSMAPGGFDQHASRRTVIGLGNAALAPRAAAGMLWALKERPPSFDST